MSAIGNFIITLTPQADEEFSVGRILIDKTYTGDMTGTGKGQMLSKRTETDGSAGYVALEEFEGTVHGKQGKFTLLHKGTMNRGEQSLDITVIPDSGQGELSGISGTYQISMDNDQHSYVFDYNL